MKMKELILPIGLVAVIGCMLLPLPPFIVDCLLVMNLVFAVLLVASSLYISSPLRLSSLPTIILLSTLYRLALNISTTRRILGAGDAGDMIEMFGHLLMQGEMFVGLVVFLVISLVQFIVIAKGSERVAEVSARFTLDALPGKQMSIDADVRSGLIDLETARKKREDLQVESRFYGALDGAMKFIKGDAIAGLVITAVNIIGGLLVGMVVRGMDAELAFQKYTLLTLGDGLLSQVPALLNSLAAGLIVTRVARENADSLAAEVLDQLGSIKPALVLAGVISGLLGCVGVATLPFLLLSGLFITLGVISPTIDGGQQEDLTRDFEPRLPSLLTILIKEDSPIRNIAPEQFKKEMHRLLNEIYEAYGLLLTPPDIRIDKKISADWMLHFRGIPVGTSGNWSEEAAESDEKALDELISGVLSAVKERKAECVDDLFTRRLLDFFENQAPELIAATVPGVVSVTQLTLLFKELLREGITIKHIDMILQTVSEQGERAGNGRWLLEEVRIALKRVISAHCSVDAVINGLRLDPVIDMWIAKSEREGEPLNPEVLFQVEQEVKRLRDEELGDTKLIVITSRGARRLLKECLSLRGLSDLTVIAEEEIDFENITVLDCGQIRVPENDAEELLGELAA